MTPLINLRLDTDFGRSSTVFKSVESGISGLPPRACIHSYAFGATPRGPMWTAGAVGVRSSCQDQSVHGTWPVIIYHITVVGEVPPRLPGIKIVLGASEPGGARGDRVRENRQGLLF